MNESETRAEVIDPALQAAGNGYVNHRFGYVRIRKNQSGGAQPVIDEIP